MKGFKKVVYFLVIVCALQSQMIACDHTTDNPGNKEEMKKDAKPEAENTTQSPTTKKCETTEEHTDIPKIEPRKPFVSKMLFKKDALPHFYDESNDKLITYYSGPEQLPLANDFLLPTHMNEYAFLEGSLMTSSDVLRDVSNCRYTDADARDFAEKIRNGKLSVNDLGVLCIETKKSGMSCYASLPISTSCPTFDPFENPYIIAKRRQNAAKSKIPMEPPIPEFDRKRTDQILENERLKSFFNSEVLNTYSISHGSAN